MKSYKIVSGAAFVVAVTNAAKLSPSELDGMYHDPEYADTWRYTNDQRYVEAD